MFLKHRPEDSLGGCFAFRRSTGRSGTLQRDETPSLTFFPGYRSRSDVKTSDAHLQDPELETIIKAIEAPEIDDFMRHNARGYMMTKGALYRYSLENNLEEPQLVVSSHERETVLKEYHDATTAGHYRVERTLSHISQQFFWIEMDRHVAERVKDCVYCLRYKAMNLKPAGLLQTPVMK